jgi:hypothetical protein
VIYPSTSVLAIGRHRGAVLTPPSGFGDGFGDAFGGWQPTVTAVLDATPGTAVLAPRNEHGDSLPIPDRAPHC